LGIPVTEVPFAVARALTALVFVVLACWFAWRAARSGDPATFCQAGFLTLAWFWLLCPTQNPWYWTWALPLVPFARNRVWLLVSGLALIYYTRFWFEYHAEETSSWGLAYQGVELFDFGIVWIEFAPLLLLLCVGYVMRGRAIQSNPDA